MDIKPIYHQGWQRNLTSREMVQYLDYQLVTLSKRLMERNERVPKLPVFVVEKYTTADGTEHEVGIHATKQGKANQIWKKIKAVTLGNNFSTIDNLIATHAHFYDKEVAKQIAKETASEEE